MTPFLYPEPLEVIYNKNSYFIKETAEDDTFKFINNSYIEGNRTHMNI